MKEAWKQSVVDGFIGQDGRDKDVWVTLYGSDGLWDEDGKGVTRYIQPNAGDLAQIVNEANRKRGLLFDFAGLALFNRETRQVQTAESKAFDQLDTNSTLGNRATLLQESEIKIVAMIKVFDPGFKGWEPKYETEFDVVDVVALGQALTLAANAPDKTPIVKKICAMINVRILKELSNGIVPDDVFDDALDEIEKHDFAAQTNVISEPTSPFWMPFSVRLRTIGASSCACCW